MVCEDAASAFVVAGDLMDPSPSSATPAFSVVEPSGISIPGFEASSPCSSDYASSYGSSVSDDGSYHGGSSYNLGGVDFSGALLRAPGSGSSAFSHRSDSSGGGGGGCGCNSGLLLETWDFPPGVGGLSVGGGGGGIFDGGFGGVPGGIFADGSGVIGVATAGVMTGNGQQTTPTDLEVMNQQHQQQVDHWFYQPHRTSQAPTPVTVGTRSSSSTADNVASPAAGAANEEVPSSGAPIDDGSSTSTSTSSGSNINFHALVLDTGGGSGNGSGTVCGSALAESWTECLETPLGVGGLEAFEACHDSNNNDTKAGEDDDKFDNLAVFAFQDHFGML